MRRACARVIPTARSIRISRVRLKPNSTSALTMPNKLKITDSASSTQKILLTRLERRHAGHLIGYLGIPGTASSVSVSSVAPLPPVTLKDRGPARAS